MNMAVSFATCGPECAFNNHGCRWTRYQCSARRGRELLHCGPLAHIAAQGLFVPDRLGPREGGNEQWIPEVLAMTPAGRDEPRRQIERPES